MRFTHLAYKYILQNKLQDLRGYTILHTAFHRRINIISLLQTSSYSTNTAWVTSNLLKTDSIPLHLWVLFRFTFKYTKLCTKQSDLWKICHRNKKKIKNDKIHSSVADKQYMNYSACGHVCSLIISNKSVVEFMHHQFLFFFFQGPSVSFKVSLLPTKKSVILSDLFWKRFFKKTFHNLVSKCEELHKLLFSVLILFINNLTKCCFNLTCLHQRLVLQNPMKII